jgi:hypothetical protein
MSHIEKLIKATDLKKLCFMSYAGSYMFQKKLEQSQRWIEKEVSQLKQ